jgi:hypothetical protein
MQTSLGNGDTCALCSFGCSAIEGNEILTNFRAREGVSEFEHALYMPAALCEKLFQDRRPSLQLKLKRNITWIFIRDIYDECVEPWFSGVAGFTCRKCCLLTESI